jgi:sortase A
MLHSQPREAIGSGARIFERALFLIAFLALGYVAWAELDRLAYQRTQRIELARLAPAGPTTGTAKTVARAEKLRVSPSGVIGRLSIPAAEIDAVITEGVDDRTLRRSVGHVPNTALPGEPGNVALAAHRDTFFRELGKLRLEDPIHLITSAGTFDYAVDDLRVVDPSDTEVLASGSTSSLTLVTCYPFEFVGAAPQRYIVRAREVGRPTP